MTVLFSHVKRKWRSHRALYRLSDGPWNYFCTCHLNRWLHRFQFHVCDHCHVSIRKPFIVVVYRRLLAIPWYCQKCSAGKEHLTVCRLEDCVICQQWIEYLREEDIKATATRALAEAGFGRIALQVPDREQVCDG